MAISLQGYHFNSIKFGEITKQYAQERGISKAALAGRIGISYDTMDNICRGMVQKIPFEIVFKISCVLGVPMEVITMLWIKDDDIAFRDMILHYDAHQDTPVLASEDVPSFVPDAVADTAAAVAAAEPPLTAPNAQPVPESQLAVVERLIAAQAAHVADLKEQFAHERAAGERYFQLMQEIVIHMCDDRPRGCVL